MTPWTLLRYLTGDHQAILELASSRWTLVIGLLFVLSAGFAREYDGEDLLHEPWHVVLPLAASLISSFGLFCLAFCGRFRSSKRPPFLEAYLSFLGLFWMTAPLAWLYAIPYERWLSPLGATQANLWTLGVVSLWRVVLMIRVLVVLFSYRHREAICVVMLFADTVALVLLQFVQVPLLDIMGGIRLSESDRLLKGIACTVLQFGGCTYIWWLLVGTTSLAISRLSWQASPLPWTKSSRPAVSLCCLALASLSVWVFILPYTQPEQQLRRQAERLFAEDRFKEALVLMSAHPRSDFPPHWEPPPRSWSRWDPKPNFEHQLAALKEVPAPPTANWVREIYLRRLVEILGGWRVHDKDLEDVIRGLSRLPEADDLLAEIKVSDDRGDRSGPEKVQRLRTRLDELRNPRKRAAEPNEKSDR